MDAQREKELFIKYKNQSMTVDELQLWNTFLQKTEAKNLLNEWMQEDWTNANDLTNNKTFAEASKQMPTVLSTFPQSAKPTNKKAWYSIAAAAVLLISLSLSALLILDKNNSNNIITPASNKATLTLADGTVIDLKNDEKGIATGENGLQYIDGTAISAESNPDQLVTLATPRGGQYRIKLADGTFVYLDASSKLIYPIDFKGKQKRLVQLQGQGYFEVAKDKNHPFVVKTLRQEVEVLGTHFVVKEFEGDENTKTVLVEGKVQVTAQNNKRVLSPGQQSIVNKNKIDISEADLDEALAWKNGQFSFNEEPLSEILKEAARWYNVDFIYEKESLKTLTFVGVVPRYEQINTLLTALEKTGDVKFEIKDREILVSQKVQKH